MSGRYAIDRAQKLAQRLAHGDIDHSGMQWHLWHTI